jgi:hypothetical protein
VNNRDALGGEGGWILLVGVGYYSLAITRDSLVLVTLSITRPALPLARWYESWHLVVLCSWQLVVVFSTGAKGGSRIEGWVGGGWVSYATCS